MHLHNNAHEVRVFEKKLSHPYNLYVCLLVETLDESLEALLRQSFLGPRLAIITTTEPYFVGNFLASRKLMNTCMTFPLPHDFMPRDCESAYVELEDFSQTRVLTLTGNAQNCKGMAQVTDLAWCKAALRFMDDLADRPGWLRMKMIAEEAYGFDGAFFIAMDGDRVMPTVEYLAKVYKDWDDTSLQLLMDMLKPELAIAGHVLYVEHTQIWSALPKTESYVEYMQQQKDEGVMIWMEQVQGFSAHSWIAIKKVPVPVVDAPASDRKQRKEKGKSTTHERSAIKEVVDFMDGMVDTLISSHDSDDRKLGINMLADIVRSQDASRNEHAGRDVFETAMKKLQCMPKKDRKEQQMRKNRIQEIRRLQAKLDAEQTTREDSATSSFVPRHNIAMNKKENDEAKQHAYQHRVMREAYEKEKIIEIQIANEQVKEAKTAQKAQRSMETNADEQPRGSIDPPLDEEDVEDAVVKMQAPARAKTGKAKQAAREKARKERYAEVREEEERRKLIRACPRVLEAAEQPLEHADDAPKKKTAKRQTAFRRKDHILSDPFGGYRQETRRLFVAAAQKLSLPPCFPGATAMNYLGDFPDFVEPPSSSYASCETLSKHARRRLKSTVPEWVMDSLSAACHSTQALHFLTTSELYRTLHRCVMARALG